MANEQLAQAAPKAVFLGDVYLGGEGGETLPDEEVEAYLSGHELRCCNFEGPAYFEGGVTQKKAGPAIMQGPKAASRVLASGFNLITVANNHAMDYGPSGLTATLSALSGATVIGAGETAALARRPFITWANGVKLGFLALTEKQYGTLGTGEGTGCAWIGDPTVRNTIRRLRAECSHVVVICHGGLEDVDQPLAQWRDVYRRFIDAGAAAVVAHHPHVPQGWEQYKNGLIFYSLGNAAWEPETEFPSGRSLAVSLTLPLNAPPSFEVKPLEYRGGKLHFCRVQAFLAHLDAINAVLNDPAAYQEEIAEICRKFYEEVALGDFFTVTGALPGDAGQRVKNAVKLLVRKPALNEALLLSMMENESYRWAVCSYLSRERG